MTLVLILFFIFLLTGMPVAFAIGIAGFAFFLQESYLPLTMPVQLILSETQAFALLAIPMFVFAGNLMNETGITKRLLEFASKLTGHMYGGIAQVSVVMSALMGGVSGSAIADASMQSRILGPSMTARGYARGWSAAVNGFTGLIVIAIPPSIGLVLYGSIGEVSIGRLLAGGLVPGLLMTLVFGTVVSFTARKKGYLPEREKAAPLREVGGTFFRSIWAMLFPIFLLVTLRGGLLVPSEAGAMAAVYAVVVGALLYREMDWQGFWRAVRASVSDTGTIMLLIALSALVSYAMKWEMIPQTLSQFLLGISDNPTVITAVILLFLLCMGMFMDSTVMILLLTSILVPVIRTLGIDPVFFGVVMVVSCAIGLLTPPVGISMYSVCSIMECSVGEYLREGWPFLVGVLLVVILLVLFPQIVLFLPNLIFG
jgi:tripartite ATP-independent transporter DctM subunit